MENKESPVSPELVHISWLMAYSAHEGQVDKWGVPYTEHLKAVRGFVESIDHEDTTSQCVALLHDILEDTPMTASQLKERGIPQEIIEAVLVLSRREGEVYREYITRVGESGNHSAILVKICDLKHNMDLTRGYELSDTLISLIRKRYLPAYHFLNRTRKNLLR